MNGASGGGIAGTRPALICFLLGLLGALPLVALTPPFQVPDESQHFLRAYQLSELRIGAIVQDGDTKAMLPSSLIGLIESLGGHFFATRWADVIIFSILVLVLVFVPSGLFGRAPATRA